jgi:hypothetical protein
VVSTGQCSVVELVRWSEVSWLLSDLVESSDAESQFSSGAAETTSDVLKP